MAARYCDRLLLMDGGALVAGALATGIDIHALASFVISCHGECQYNPWRMFPCTDRALQRFVGQATASQFPELAPPAAGAPRPSGAAAVACLLPGTRAVHLRPGPAHYGFPPGVLGQQLWPGSWASLGQQCWPEPWPGS